MDEKEELGCCSSCHECPGCNHDVEGGEEVMEEGVITFTDDEGNDVEFEILDVVPFENKEYLVVMPCDGEDDGGVVILEIKEEDGEEVYDTVIDDELAEKIFEEFKKVNDVE